jgi:nucleotide-binding universal stress UspA family protein
MYRNLLLALSHDEASRHASHIALDIAARLRAAVTALFPVDLPTLATINPGFGVTYYAFQHIATLREILVSSAQETNEEFSAAAKKLQVDHLEKTPAGTAWELLSQETLYHDLVILGTRAHFSFGLHDDDPTLGKSLRKLVDHASCPLLCVAQAALGSERVMVGLDGRPGSARALHQFLQSGLLPDAQIVLYYCDERSSITEEPKRASIQRLLEAHERRFRFEREQGSVRAMLPAAAERFAADLIVVGPHGKGRIAEAILGNTCLDLLREARFHVFVGQ